MTTPPLKGIKRVGATLYALNSAGVNRWSAQVQPGTDDKGRRIGDEECVRIAAILADRSTPSRSDGWISVADRLPSCAKKAGSLGVEVLIDPPHEDGSRTAFFGRRQTKAPAFYKYGVVLHGVESWMPLPAAPGSAAAAPIYVACRQCDECSHCGINDDHDEVDVCSACGETAVIGGPDNCASCGKEGTMCIACPKCTGRYALVAEDHLAAQAPAPVVQVIEAVVQWSHRLDDEAQHITERQVYDLSTELRRIVGLDGPVVQAETLAAAAPADT